MQAYGGAYGMRTDDGPQQPAASQESARESVPAGSDGRTASFGGDATLPAKKRGRNAAAATRCANKLARLHLVLQKHYGSMVYFVCKSSAVCAGLR